MKIINMGLYIHGKENHYKILLETGDSLEVEGIAGAKQFLESSVLDKEENRLWHAADNTWWKRDMVTGRLKRADMPGFVKELKARVFKLDREVETVKDLIRHTSDELGLE